MTEVSNANESGNATTAEKPKKKAAKKKAAKKTTKKTETKSGNAAGRPKGVWSVLQAGALRPWRESANISRGRLAQMLRVSPTSVQNWETDKAIPSTKYQEAIVSLMNGNVPVANAPKPKRGRPPKASTTSTTNATNANVVDMGGSSVGSIVTSYVSGIVTNYVQKNGKMSIDDLAKTLDIVRSAFAK